jgi:hypothetical protein
MSSRMMKGIVDEGGAAMARQLVAQAPDVTRAGEREVL